MRRKKKFLEPFEINCGICGRKYTIDKVKKKLKREDGELFCVCGEIITFYNELELEDKNEIH